MTICMIKIMELWLLLNVIFFSAFVHSHGSVKHDNFIRGTYRAWWVIVGVDKSSAAKMLNGLENMKDVNLLNETLAGFPSAQHPVLFEIGNEMNCGPSISSALRSDFFEFKFEIPFVTSPKSKVPVLNYKQRLFESNSINSVSSNVMYGLDATRANIKMTDTSYQIQLDDKTIFSSNFTESDKHWINARDFPLLKSYVDIMNLTWFGRRKFGVCAQHHYDFDTALVKPSNTHMIFDKAFINPYFPMEEYNVDQMSAKNVFGAVQIQVNFTMTLPQMCFQ